MKTLKSITGVALLILTILYGCGSENSKTPTKPTEKTESNKKEDKGLSAELLGNYHGMQSGYFMKNQYGDDMIINGNKIAVPAIDFKFLLKENNIVSLQQTNLDDNSRVYYDGNYKIILDEKNTTKIECSLSDGKTSKPIYTMTISKNDKKGTCNGNNEPEFSIEKTL
jgi:hypothetical protein